jgi:uncharacterized membrane protein
MPPDVLACREADGMAVLLVVVFDDETGADAGADALRALHTEGGLTLYAVSVVARRAKGGGLEVRAPMARGEGASAPAVGAAVGALVSLLGGPLTAAARTAECGLVGPVRDLAAAGLDAGFLEQISRDLRPGGGAAVAQVEDEDGQLVLDARLGALGGRVLRHRLAGSLAEERLMQDLAALRGDLARIEAVRNNEEHAAAAKAARRTRTAELKRALKRAQDIAVALRREGAAKVEVLRAQAARLEGDARAAVENRASRVRAGLEARAARLDRVVEGGARAEPGVEGRRKRGAAPD